MIIWSLFNTGCINTAFLQSVQHTFHFWARSCTYFKCSILHSLHLTITLLHQILSKYKYVLNGQLQYTWKRGLRSSLVPAATGGFSTGIPHLTSLCSSLGIAAAPCLPPKSRELPYLYSKMVILKQRNFICKSSWMCTWYWDKPMKVKFHFPLPQEKLIASAIAENSWSYQINVHSYLVIYICRFKH